MHIPLKQHTFLALGRHSLPFYRRLRISHYSIDFLFFRALYAESKYLLNEYIAQLESLAPVNIGPYALIFQAP